MSIQTELIEKYILLLMEYIHLIHSSEIIKQLENAQAIFHIGFNAVVHIYKMTFLATKNVESAGCYTQKGMYCYLEYIEQMNRTNTLHNLDNMDAILFVYDKTLSDLYSPNGASAASSGTTHQQNMFINILSLNHPHTEEIAWKAILENLAYITKIVLWFDHRSILHIQRIDLTHEYLHKYLLLYLEYPFSHSPQTGEVGVAVANSFKENSTLELLKYISVVQEKIEITYPQYIEMLDLFYKTQKKTMKQKRLPTSSLIREKCMSLSVFLPGRSYSEITSTEFGKSEGWKTNGDFVRWMFV